MFKFKDLKELADWLTSQSKSHESQANHKNTNLRDKNHYIGMSRALENLASMLRHGEICIEQEQPKPTKDQLVKMLTFEERTRTQVKELFDAFHKLLQQRHAAEYLQLFKDRDEATVAFGKFLMDTLSNEPMKEQQKEEVTSKSKLFEITYTAPPGRGNYKTRVAAQTATHARVLFEREFPGRSVLNIVEVTENDS